SLRRRLVPACLRDDSGYSDNRRRQRGVPAGVAQPARQVSALSNHAAKPGPQPAGAYQPRACEPLGPEVQRCGWHGLEFMTGRIASVQDALRQAGLDGWLFYDFRLSDPIAYRVLELSEHGATTRRWFCLVPARGPVQTIVSAVEAHRLDALGAEPIVYRSHAEMVAGLHSILVPAHRIAMNYSPKAAIPYVSRVDAGTLEQVRSTGVGGVSSACHVERCDVRVSAARLGGQL